jgi:hypothetical protein
MDTITKFTSHVSGAVMCHEPWLVLREKPHSLVQI